MSKNIRFITRTAILLALVVVFQMVGRMIPYNNFIVGPLVNACLLISTAIAGVWSGVVIAVLSPFTSLINNHAPIAPILLLFAPFVAIGNSLLVAAFGILKKKNEILGIVIGALLKFGFLWGAIVTFINVKGDIKPAVAKTLTGLFSYPQLITALIGGAVALVAIKALKKNIEY